MKKFLKKGSLYFRNSKIEKIYSDKFLKENKQTCKGLTIIYLVLRTIGAVILVYGCVTLDKSDPNFKTNQFLLYMTAMTCSAFLLNLFFLQFLFFENFRGTILILTLLIECAETSNHFQTEFLPLK